MTKSTLASAQDKMEVKSMALPKNKRMTIMSSDLGNRKSAGKATIPRSRFDKHGSTMAGGTLMDHPYSADSMANTAADLDK